MGIIGERPHSVTLQNKSQMFDKSLYDPRKLVIHIGKRRLLPRYLHVCFTVYRLSICGGA